MTYPIINISLETKGDKIEVLQHTIDPALEKYVGKDESECFLTFDSNELEKVLALAEVKDISELEVKLKKAKSLTKFRELLDSNKIPFESFII